MEHSRASNLDQVFQLCLNCNALSNYLIILLDDMVYVYILYDFDDYVTYL